MCLTAARSAIDDALLLITGRSARIGVVVGTALGPIEVNEAFGRGLLEAGSGGADPTLFPGVVQNAAAGNVAIHTGAVGPTSTVTAGHAAGAVAIAYARDLLVRNAADAIVCVAADTLSPSVSDVYRSLGFFEHDGIALTEAAVAVVLEREAMAVERGRIRGYLGGYGIASDGLGIARWDPRGRGLARAMHEALRDAGMDAGEVTDVWGTAYGSRASDLAERAAISRVVGSSARYHRPKRRVGEPLGAGGPLNLAASIRAFSEGDGGVSLINSSSLSGVHVSIAVTPS